jgi:phosphopantothenoylcysteine synthetase/decarboxylase
VGLNPILVELFDGSGPLHRMKGDEDLSFFLADVRITSETDMLEAVMKEVYSHIDKPLIVKNIIAAAVISGFRSGKRFERELAKGDAKPGA